MVSVDLSCSPAKLFSFRPGFVTAHTVENRPCECEADFSTLTFAPHIIALCPAQPNAI
jgi:hypothetical protein